MQKKNPQYSALKEDTVWSVEKLNDYVNETYSAAKGLPRDWITGDFTVSLGGLIMVLMLLCECRFKIGIRMTSFIQEDSRYVISCYVVLSEIVWCVNVAPNDNITISYQRTIKKDYKKQQRNVNTLYCDSDLSLGSLRARGP